ncbi:MAG TPA: hypothetical protein VK524_13715 [Polyangiaceae bacterium]|nr:hypothetical protein [Polyangiaceae bacterium]
MTKSQPDNGDWSDDSESLFAAARGDHDATAADRVRVRNALSARLAGGAAASHPAGGSAGSSAAKSVHLMTLGNFVKLSLVVAIVAAGSFALTRTLGRAAEPARPPHPVAPVRAMSDVAPSDHSTPVVSREEPNVRAHDPFPRATATGSERSASAGFGARRKRSDRVSTRGRTSRADRTDSELQLQPMSAPGSTPERSHPARLDSKGANMPADTRTQAAIGPLLPNATQTAALEPARGAASLDESTSARAELAFVRRIHAAMREAKPSAALALCVQHEQRWPHGTFALEREGVRAIALCDTRSRQAAFRAREFLSNHGRTPLAPRVEAACAQQLSAPAADHSFGIEAGVK